MRFVVGSRRRQNVGAVPLSHGVKPNARWSFVASLRWGEIIDRAAKRGLDGALSALLLLLMLPVFVAIALAIKLDSRGPVIYVCRRVGHRGGVLHMLKFRKLVDAAGGPPLTVEGDVRFTRVGRFLAKSKLDELPQLWNVLKGEMSLVGPRPEDAEFVDRFAAEYREILRVKPGIAGLCQLAFAKENEILDPDDSVPDYVHRLLPQKIKLDLLYAERRSLTMDLMILLWTLVVTLVRRDVAVDRATGQLSLRKRGPVFELQPIETAASVVAE